MNLRERLIYDFGLKVLKILETEQDWTPGTLDDISAVAYDYSLADSDDDGLFCRSSLAMGETEDATT